MLIISILHIVDKFVSDAFQRSDMFIADFFAYFADMNVNGAVAHHQVATPYGAKNLLTVKYFFGFGHQQRQQLEFLAR